LGLPPSWACGCPPAGTVALEDVLSLFSTPHYEGYGAMLIRLADVGADDLADYLLDAWMAKASPKWRKEFDATL